MGARLRRSGKAGVVAFMTAIALIGSAWLAFATTAPGGPSNGYGTTTTTAARATTTSMKATTTTTKSTTTTTKSTTTTTKSTTTTTKPTTTTTKPTTTTTMKQCPPPKPPKDDYGHGYSVMGSDTNHHDDNCPPPCKPENDHGHQSDFIRFLL